MKIEFNGRAVASFVLGLIVGAIGMGIGLAVGPIGRIQLQRDALVADRDTLVANQEREKKLLIETSTLLTSAANQLNQCNSLRAADAVWQATVAQNNGPALAKPADAGDQLRLLNILRPGLGDLAAKLYQAKNANGAVQP